jgi:hypothetical protein
MKETALRIFPYIIMLLVVVLYVRSCVNYEKQLLITEQNALAEQNKLRQLNLTTYHKYVFIEDLKDSLIEELKQNEEIILAQSETIFKFKNIIEENEGTIIRDTIFVEVPFDCIGLRLGFSNSNNFYSYTDTITVDNPPTHKLSLSFNPIKATSYLTRNEEGIWSGYLKLDEKVSNYLKIGNFDIKVSEDLYLNNNSVPSFSLIPNFIINTNYTSTQFGLGLFGLINDAHLVGYGKSINTNFHTFTYGYKFNF